jgi:hypothetical protein
LSERQRATLQKKLTPAQQQSIQKSYETGGWADVLARNELDGIIDETQKKFGINMIWLRCHALKGSNVYVRRTFWDEVIAKCSKYTPAQVFYVIGGILATEDGALPHEYRLVRATTAQSGANPDDGNHDRHPLDD